MHYYNEIDPYCCAWLDALMEEGLIPHGVIDHRSIVDVSPADLRGFVSCHFFAGLGGWPLALRMAGWGDDRPVWTGSCPCQPFSVAGRRKGTKDERHLWPVFYDIIRKLAPPDVLGEQVASPDGLQWLSGVRTNLEDSRYAVGAADYPAAGVGAPHIRQRLYWAAKRLVYSASAGRGRSGSAGEALHGHGTPQPAGRSGGGHGMDDAARQLGDGLGQARRRDGEPADAGDGNSGMGDAIRARPQERPLADGIGGAVRDEGAPALPTGARGSGSAAGFWVAVARGGFAQRLGEPGDVARTAVDAARERDQRERRWSPTLDRGERSIGLSDADGEGLGECAQRDGSAHAGSTLQIWDDPVRPCALGEDFWRDAVWIDGPDGKWRRVKPGVRLLANGIPARVAKLRAFGNAIVPEAAERFVIAYLAARSC